jgi:hypothetical protein
LRSGRLVVEQLAPPPILAAAVLFDRSGGYRNRVREAGSVIRCVERGAESEELVAGWRAYLAGDFNEDEDEVLLYRPECARREFGPFDGGLTA